MWRSRWRCVIKPAYSFSFLLSINIFVWQNVLYFLDAPRILWQLYCTSLILTRFITTFTHVIIATTKYSNDLKYFRILKFYIFQCTNPSTINVFTTVLLHIADDKKVKQLFCATVRSLTMGQWGPKHVGVGVSWHYCDSNELWAFVGLNGGKWIIMHGMQNVKFTDLLVIKLQVILG